MKKTTPNLKKIIKRSSFELFTLIAVFVASLSFVIPPVTRAAASAVAPSRAVALEVSAMQNATAPFGNLPKAGLGEPTYTMKVTATAYNSEVGQTDDTPFITASGTTVRHGVIAANFLPIGTMVKIPDLYGDQIFTVEDRMNPRYDKRVDIWMVERSEAIQFGVRTIAIEVYKNK